MVCAYRMNLKEIQQAFYQSLSGSEIDVNLIKEIALVGQGMPTKRFAIYRNNRNETLTNTLKNTYPVCLKLVGERFFNAMAKAYILNNASYSPTLDQYGNVYPSFIQTYEPVSALPYLADIAKLEWARMQISIGPDQNAINYAGFANINTQFATSMVFELPVNSILMQSDYPILDIWQLNQGDFCGNSRVDLSQGGVKLIIWRKDWELLMEAVSAPQWDLLTLIAQGMTLEAICQAEVGESLNIQALLPELIAKSWITGYHSKVCER